MTKTERAVELVNSGMKVKQAAKKAGLADATTIYKKLREAKRKGGCPKGKKRGKKVVKTFTKTYTKGDNEISLSWQAKPPNKLEQAFDKGYEQGKKMADSASELSALTVERDEAKAACAALSRIILEAMKRS